jgi:hypothetical protein
MALEAIEGLSPVVRQHTQVVRMFMRDFAELNLLVKGEESSDRMIAWATFDFLSDFNGTPPFTGVGLDYIYARGWQSFALRGTVVTLLQSLMILYGRNHLPFSDGGISINMNDKAPLIMQFLSFMQSAYEQNKRNIKTTMNIEQLLSPDSTGLFSDYSRLASSYGF